MRISHVNFTSKKTKGKNSMIHSSPGVHADLSGRWMSKSFVLEVVLEVVVLFLLVILPVLVTMPVPVPMSMPVPVPVSMPMPVTVSMPMPVTVTVAVPVMHVLLQGNVG
eukprot:Selendium_serpulae@DN5450_c0_g1_i1.p3